MPQCALGLLKGQAVHTTSLAWCDTRNLMPIHCDTHVGGCPVSQQGLLTLRTALVDLCCLAPKPLSPKPLSLHLPASTSPGGAFFSVAGARPVWLSV